MGNHVVWRKTAKRERRRRLRIQQAKLNDPLEKLSETEYKVWMEEQEELEIFEREQIEKQNQEENFKWLEAERVATVRYEKLRRATEHARIKQLEQEIRIKKEWEEEQKRVKEAEAKLKQIEEEKRQQQQVFLDRLEQFLEGDLTDPPDELLISHESRPNTEPCPFFTKTACCRFGDLCSRNHQYPGIAKTLLAANFYTHFGLNNSSSNEYDTDVMLEYEESDDYRDFKEFFNDVAPEFEKFGKIIQFKVCNNYEKHLRGNTYIEFAELRCAVKAYRSLHCRWYGGRQISLQFCTIKSWKNAICGLQSSRKCPKGRSCNFLHVFRNPNNLLNSFVSNQEISSRGSSPRRPWRWSESPEVEISRKRRSTKERSPSNDRRSQRKRRPSKESLDRSRSSRRRHDRDRN